jgi:hypothetical protein
MLKFVYQIIFLPAQNNEPTKHIWIRFKLIHKVI